jgi:hypothetical protein
VSFGGLSDTFLQGVITAGTTFEFEYLGEFANDLEKNLGNDSGVHLGSIRERQQRLKVFALLFI